MRKVFGAEHLLCASFTAVELLAASATCLWQQRPDQKLSHAPLDRKNKALCELRLVWLPHIDLEGELQAYWIFDTKEQRLMLNEIKCLLDTSDVQCKYFQYV